eukprot:65292_1
MPRKKKKKRRRKTKTHKSTKSSSVEITESTNTSTISHSNSSSNTNNKRKSKSSKSSKKPKDRNKPKKPLSSYFLFANDTRDSFKQKHPNKTMPQLSKLISAKWKQMSTDEKKPYNDKAQILRDKHKQKIIEYQKTQSHKNFQQILKQWEESQTQTKNHKSNTNSAKTIQKRGKKRKRHKKTTNNISNASHSSLSSILSDNDEIFTSQTTKKRRKIMHNNHNNNNNNNTSNDSDYLSDELSETFDGIDLVQHKNHTQNENENNDMETDELLTIADVIRNNKYGKEMPSTIRARQLKIENENNSDNINDDEKHSDNEDEILKCKQCERIFFNINILETHEKKIHKYKCKKCKLQFMSEGLLEDHMNESHDPFAEDICNDKIRIENGEFQLNDSQAKDRWILNRSHYRQQKRTQYQMNKCTKRIIVSEEKSNNGIIYKKRDKKINTQSFNKSLRNNMGLTWGWSKPETERFYKVLKYTGLNFQFMETIYNKAITRDINSKWRYRDHKMIQKKYKREEKYNSDIITDIAHNSVFTVGNSDIIAELVGKNEFKLKDEKYFKDSDIESESEHGNDNDNNDESEEEFNPLRGYKEEIEMDKQFDRDRKKKDADELEAWRLKREKSMSGALDKFKKEQEEYRKYKAIKEQSV